MTALMASNTGLYLRMCTTRRSHSDILGRLSLMQASTLRGLFVVIHTELLYTMTPHQQPSRTKTPLSTLAAAASVGHPHLCLPLNPHPHVPSKATTSTTEELIEPTIATSVPRTPKHENETQTPQPAPTCQTKQSNPPQPDPDPDPDPLKPLALDTPPKSAKSQSSINI